MGKSGRCWGRTGQLALLTNDTAGPGVPATLPAGTATLAHMEDNVVAAAFQLEKNEEMRSARCH